MTKQEYKNKIKELQDELEQLKKVKIETEQCKRLKPELNEIFWIVNPRGDLDQRSWDNDRYDNWQYLTGNCFKTKEEAEERKKQIEYTAQYKNYIEEHSEPLDWKDSDEIKFYGQFNFMQNEIEVDFCFCSKRQGIIYASSEKIILDAIKEIGKNNFKKYVLGVKND